MTTLTRTLNAIQHQELRFKQQENAAKTYTVNWGPELDGNTISTSAWSSDNGMATIANEANTTTEASARLSATNPGTVRIVNKVVDSAGDTHERVIILTVQDNNEAYTDYL